MDTPHLLVPQSIRSQDNLQIGGDLTDRIWIGRQMESLGFVLNSLLYQDSKTMLICVQEHGHEASHIKIAKQCWSLYKKNMVTKPP